MKGLLIWLWLAQGADLGTTAIALNRGCVEANPILGRMSPTAMASTKMAVTVTVTWHFGRKVTPTKGEKLAVAAFAAAGTVGASLNANTIPKCRRAQ
jgi:hypothetical protein